MMEGTIPVGNARVVVASLDGGTDVRVHPEWPQRVIQVEGDQLGQRQAIGEGFGGHRGIFQRLGVLAFGAQHGRRVYKKDNESKEQKNERNQRAHLC